MFLAISIFFDIIVFLPPSLPLCTTVQIGSKKGVSSVIWLPRPLLFTPLPLLYHYAPLRILLAKRVCLKVIWLPRPLLFTPTPSLPLYAIVQTDSEKGVS